MPPRDHVARGASSCVGLSKDKAHTALGWNAKMLLVGERECVCVCVHMRAFHLAT